MCLAVRTWSALSSMVSTLPARALLVKSACGIPQLENVLRPSTAACEHMLFVAVNWKQPSALSVYTEWARENVVHWKHIVFCWQFMGVEAQRLGHWTFDQAVVSLIPGLGVKPRNHGVKAWCAHLCGVASKTVWHLIWWQPVVLRWYAVTNLSGFNLFTRVSIYAIARICYRPSVHTSVSLSVSLYRVYHRKTVKVKIMKFSPYGSPIALVFVGQVSSRNSKGFPKVGASNKGGVGKVSSFLSLSVNIS